MKFAEIMIAILLGVIFLVWTIFTISFKRDRISKLKTLIEEKSFSIEDYNDERKLRRKKSIILEILLGVIVVISSALFINSLVLKSPKLRQNYVVVSVNTTSMASFDESNTYIKENGIENKIYQYDICKFKKLEDQSEINKYDIVLYRSYVDNKPILIAHRIVNINEDATYEVRGDANKVSDKFDLTFNDIIGVYEKRLGFSSFLNYLTYTPGFYMFYVGSIVLIGVTFYFDQKEKKLVS